MAMFSQRHYVAIAEVIAKVHAQVYADQQYVVRWIADDLSHKFEQDNPRFDREKFLQAAGVK